MLEFFNKLKQLWSFKILSVLGYLTIISWIWTIATVPIDAPYVGFLGMYMVLTIFALLYFALFIILIFIGIFEYQKKKEKFKETQRNFWFYLFLTGLNLPLLIIIIMPFAMILYAWLKYSY